MSRPDFKCVNDLINIVEKQLVSFENIFEGTDLLEYQLSNLCLALKLAQARESLKEISVDELKNAKANIRTSLLEEAGINTLYDITDKTEAELIAIDGIGEKQAEQIQSIVLEFQKTLSKKERIHLTADKNDPQMCILLTSLARYQKADAIRKEVEPLRDVFPSYVREVTDQIRIRSNIRWLFSRSKTKTETEQAVKALSEYCKGEEYKSVVRFIMLFGEAFSIDEAAAIKDFRKNSASYYAILESLTGSELSEHLLYGSVPERLAAEIQEVELDLRSFKGILRRYQKFGAQYILHQGKVLLGDEMGLGKTIQAMAAMAHLAAKEPKVHFLVVCPASVMMNWCRETAKFSELPVFLLHGIFLEKNLMKWESSGGVAVTNYESTGKVLYKINGKEKLSLLVVDEAHYIKNPAALRTKNVHALGTKAERILLMSGTPLENKVDEMCELIGFIRPDMINTVREYALAHNTDAFKEALASVYLRRQVEQVLPELPPVMENDEWCVLTEEDRKHYQIQITEGNFMGMRRVSFLQDDMLTSSKMVRLREICDEAVEEGKKIVVFSYFRDTISKVRKALGKICIGEITGSTSVLERQNTIDRFTNCFGRQRSCLSDSGWRDRAQYTDRFDCGVLRTTDQTIVRKSSYCKTSPNGTDSECFGLPPPL